MFVSVGVCARARADGKDRVKNDSQVSVGAIYSNGKLWVERVWVGVRG